MARNLANSYSRLFFLSSLALYLLNRLLKLLKFNLSSSAAEKPFVCKYSVNWAYWALEDLPWGRVLELVRLLAFLLVLLAFLLAFLLVLLAFRLAISY